MRLNWVAGSIAGAVILTTAAAARITSTPLLQPMAEAEWQVGSGCYARDARGRTLLAQEWSTEPAIIKIGGTLVRPGFPDGNLAFDGSRELRTADGRTVVRFANRRPLPERKGAHFSETRDRVDVTVTHDGVTERRTLTLACGD